MTSRERLVYQWRMTRRRKVLPQLAALVQTQGKAL